MTKNELRRSYRQQRSALSSADWARRCEAITDQFMDWLVHWPKQKPLVLHSFLPIESQNEVDTWRIIRRLWREKPAVQIVVPVTDLVGGTMTHYPIDAGTQFKRNRYGIPEPSPILTAALLPDQFDMVLVPLLAFDHQGQRVGYGGGFYDRFLAQCSPGCLRVGLSFFKPVEPIQDVYEGDIPLSLCVTPSSVCHFGTP